MKRVFLVGCPRSGTTLLQSMLCAHPQIASYPESHFFKYIVPRWKLLRAMGVASRLAGGALTKVLAQLDCNADAVEKPILMIGYRQYADYFVRLLDNCTALKNRSLWIEKTPEHLRYIDWIDKLVKGAVFIHIIRNGVDVVASLYDVAERYPMEWNGPWSIDHCIMVWKRAIEDSRKFVGLKKHQFVRYENLTGHPESTLKEIAQFLGIEYHTEMLESYSRQLKHISLQSEPWKAGVSGNIKRNGDNKFKKLFDDVQQSHIRKRVNDVDLSMFGDAG